jgi:hypothetical protein
MADFDPVAFNLASNAAGRSGSRIALAGWLTITAGAGVNRVAGLNPDTFDPAKIGAVR